MGYSNGMTRNMYVIQWKSKTNGRAGKGTKLFERDEADRLVQELNQEYPQIEHEAIKVDPRAVAANQSRHEPSDETVTVE